jgi:seryl-tRNA synthetase
MTGFNKVETFDINTPAGRDKILKSIAVSYAKGVTPAVTLPYFTEEDVLRIGDFLHELGEI